MSYPLVRELAADGIPVVVTCRVLGFTPQAFYKWRYNPVSAREWDDAHLVDAAREIHADDPAFGYRFITDELASERGIRASENPGAPSVQRPQHLLGPRPQEGPQAEAWGAGARRPGPPEPVVAPAPPEQEIMPAAQLDIIAEVYCPKCGRWLGRNMNADATAYCPKCKAVDLSGKPTPLTVVKTVERDEDGRVARVVEVTA